jgi:uncharacterized membrane protein
MLRYLVQVIQNLLTTGILAAWLFALSGDGKGKAAALRGCAVAAAAALILSVLRRTTALINRGFFNTWILSFAIYFGILYIVLQWRLLKPKFLLKYTSFHINVLLLTALFFYALPTIFLYPAEFVLAGQSVLSTEFLFKFIGYAAGLAVVAVAGAALYQSGRVLPVPLVRGLLTAALLVTMCSQAAAIVQFLLARRIIPMIGWLFTFIIVADAYKLVVLYVLAGLAFVSVAVLFIRSLQTGGSWKNPAEHRKIRSARRTQRRWCLTAAVSLGLSLFSLTFLRAFLERGVELSPAEPMTIAGEEILIPIGQVQDGRLHRFNYAAADNIEMRFIVIKKNEAAYGVGLDACDICGATGYYQRKEEVICRLCDVVMNISTIGFRGGCNPVPLAYTLAGGNMVIRTGDLEKERNRFK